MCSHKFMHGWHYFWEGKRGKHLIPIKTRHPHQGEAMQKNHSSSICSSVIKANGRYSWTLKSTFFPSLFTYAQLCLTLCNPMDCSPSGSSLHGIFQARILKQRCHFLHQGIFPTQGLNPCLLSLLNWPADSLPLHHLGKALSHFQDLEYQRDFQEVANLCQWGIFYAQTPMTGIFCQLCYLVHHVTWDRSMWLPYQYPNNNSYSPSFTGFLET